MNVRNQISLQTGVFLAKLVYVTYCTTFHAEDNQQRAIFEITHPKSYCPRGHNVSRLVPGKNHGLRLWMFLEPDYYWTTILRPECFDNNRVGHAQL